MFRVSIVAVLALGLFVSLTNYAWATKGSAEGTIGTVTVAGTDCSGGCSLFSITEWSASASDSFKVRFILGASATCSATCTSIDLLVKGGTPSVTTGGSGPISTTGALARFNVDDVRITCTVDVAITSTTITVTDTSGGSLCGGGTVMSGTTTEIFTQ